jgi:hypothetical protein
MTLERASNAAGSLLQVQQKLEQFRAERKQRTRLPEPLWQAAVELAKQYGVYRTARQLRLDYTGLKKRLGGCESQENSTTSFVELFPRPAKPEECIIEMETAGGSRMRVQWKSGLPPDWAGLLRAWRENER